MAKKNSNFKLIFISFLILCIIIGVYLLASGFWNDITGVPSFDKPLLKALKEIPEEKCFYYFYNEKIYLDKKVRPNKVFFIREDKDTKLYVKQTLAVGFLEQVPKSKILPIFEKENLVIKKITSYGPYIIKTTPESKYLDAIRMSQHLVENYEIIKYAEPDFVLHTNTGMINI